ncbi:hypothetical protein L596_023801 [Steinernema carpocapsae]|uniref:Nematode cuticle collagen N-terminal domain-containing protein n=1 Tax=Steinernema carpocapsae TaxID=34508 RepID=A0A4U5MER9_STECR|nr:hypothetical protein L596_023801 [Steinernema carpocapsae]
MTFRCAVFFLAAFVTSTVFGQFVYEAPAVVPAAAYNAYLPGYYNYPYLSYPYLGSPYAYAIGSNKGSGQNGPSRPSVAPKLANDQ